MPEHIMIFGHDEEIEHRNAMQGTSAKCVMWELDREMRNCTRHDGPPCVVEDDEGGALYNETASIATQYWRDRLWAIAGDYGIRLDEE